MDIITYALCRKFVKKSLAGLGALRGSPCKIKSIVPTFSSEDPAVVLYNTLTLQWDSNESRDPSTEPIWHEEQVKVLDNGRGVYNIEYDPAGSTAEHNRYIVTFYDGTTDEFFIPTSSGSLKKKVVPVLPLATDADHNTIYLVPIAGKPGSYEQWLTVENDDTHAWEWLSLGTTDVDLTLYQQKIDTNINRSYKNYDPATKAEKPTVPNVVGGINEHQDVLGTTYDYGAGNIHGLNTWHNQNVLSALNDVGDVRNFEEWDPVTETPLTVVEEINMANKKYTLETPGSVDRTKYINVQQLIKDNRDGSPRVQIGEDILTNRVDIDPLATPDLNDYRTYQLRVANELFDPLDPSADPYGKVKIPTTRIIKEDTPVDDVVDTITPAAWTDLGSGEYTANVTLSHIPAETPSFPAAITLAPSIGGTVVLDTTVDVKTAVVHVTGASGVPIAGTTVATIHYEGYSNSIAATYYLAIEGRPWSYPVSGAKIEISKQMVVKDANVRICTEEGVPLPHLHVGERYLDLEFELPDGTIKHVYIAAKDLVTPQKGYLAIHIEYNTAEEKDEIKLYIDDPDGLNALTQSEDGLKIAKASNAQYGVSRFATRDEVLSAASVPEIVIRPYDVYDFLNNSETVKDDVNTYVDPATGEKINKTTIGAINEILSTAVVKLGIPDEDDVSTYIVRDLPASGVTNILGEKIHDIKQIIVTPTLLGITSPKPYIIYRLTELEDVYEPGLYMYDETGLVWIKVNGDDAIRTVDALPTTNIKLNCFYKLKVEDIINGRFDLTHDAKVAGYYANKAGIHYRGAVSQDWTWSAILIDWDNWYGDEIEDNIDGDIYSVTHIDGITELIYQYVNVDNRLYYHHNGNWIEISPKFVGKYMDADENFITNIDADELKPQLAEDKGKTFVVQDDGSWALGAAGGILMVEELPELDEAIDGIGYYLTGFDPYHDKATYAVHEKEDGTKEWVIVGMERNNAYKTLTKLGDYLYFADYDNIDYKYAHDRYEATIPGGCTSLWIGDIFGAGDILGRNLDWFYDNTVEFVVRTPATGNLHAVLGMTGTFKAMTKEVVERGGYNPNWKYVPFTLVDGINDAGLSASVNVCYLENDMVPTTGTHPEITDQEHQLPATMLVRFVLDHYSDAWSAYWDLYENYNIFFDDKLHDMGCEAHYLIGDQYWYFENNQLLWAENPFYHEEQKINVLTNFRLHDMIYTGDIDHPVYDIAMHTADPSKAPSSLGIKPHSQGLERFNIVASELLKYPRIYLDKTNPRYIRNIRNLLTDSLKYSNAYRREDGPIPEVEWLSEAVNGDLTADSLAPDFEAAEVAMKEMFAERSRDTAATWHTTHTAVYDIASGVLYYVSQEDGLTAGIIELFDRSNKEIIHISYADFNGGRHAANNILYIVSELND